MKDRHKNRGGHNKINLEGTRFGKLLVIEDSGQRKSKRPIWKCLCDCGKECYILGKYLSNGNTKSCGCWYKTNNSHNHGGFGYITLSYYNSIKRQAIRRGIEFAVTPEELNQVFISQNKKCYITDIDIVLVNNLRDAREKQTASLDRINNNKGYTIDNVRWTHKVINIMKNVLSLEEFHEWCLLVVKSKRFGLPVIHTPVEV